MFSYDIQEFIVFLIYFLLCGYKMAVFSQCIICEITKKVNVSFISIYFICRCDFWHLNATFSHM